MGNIDWLPFSELPEAFKDGRWILLSGGLPDWADHSSVLPPPAVTAFYSGEDGWIMSLAEAGYVAVSYLNPTHFAEINPPAGK